MAPRKKSTPQQINVIKPMPEAKNGDILDVDQATALLKVSKKTTYNRVKSGTIPHARLGRKLLFNQQKLIQWVADGGDNAAIYRGWRAVEPRGSRRHAQQR